MMRELPQPIANKITTDDIGVGCWTWMGVRSKGGYGVFGNPKKYVHRLVYELLVGPIPEGLTIDHLCRNRFCVNPAHLEPVTARENLRRGYGMPGINSRKTHCVHGHEFTESNTRIRPNGARQCRACHRSLMQKRRESST